MAHLIGHWRKFENKYYKAWRSFKRKKEAQGYTKDRRIYGDKARITKEKNPQGGYEYYIWLG